MCREMEIRAVAARLTSRYREDYASLASRRSRRRCGAAPSRFTSPSIPTRLVRSPALGCLRGALEEHQAPQRSEQEPEQRDSWRGLVPALQLLGLARLI